MGDEYGVRISNEDIGGVIAFLEEALTLDEPDARRWQICRAVRG